MSVRIAINGFGRIGRAIARIALERHDIEIVAINDLTDVATLAHLFKYDSVHGRFNGEVASDAESITAKGKRMKCLAVSDPSKLPWGDLKIDVVLECTGRFTKKSEAMAHVAAGARKVIVSAPAKGVDRTIVVGVNHEELDKANDVVISCGSCTTNCLSPLAKVLDEKIGIVNGLMTTVHAYTSDQRLHDAPHSDMRRARAAALSMVPTTTGAAVAVAEVLPRLKGKLDGLAIRVPTPNVSVVDLVFTAARETTVEEVNAFVKAAAAAELKGILQYTDEELVSIDMNGNPHSSIFDSQLTRVQSGTLVKVMSWYDNEWGFSNRMVDLARLFGG
jgi:glyceraldehyde 3-phosphate dehydrogenase